MIELFGLNLTEETVKLACEKYGIRFPEPEYHFESGDVVCTKEGCIRVICKDHTGLLSFALNGTFQSIGQDEFEKHGYKKIGVLKDYIKI